MRHQDATTLHRSNAEATEEGAGGRFYYGWVMLPIATLAMIATSPAQTFGISAFNDSFRRAFDLSNSELSGAYMIGTLLAALPMSHIGGLADRHGLKRTMTVVIFLFGLACLAVTQVAGLITLLLAFMALRMLGQGALGLLSGNTLPYWFERRLGTVEGLRQFGMAGAIATVPAVLLWLVGTVGWRWAYAIVGLSLWAVMLPLMVFFKNHPSEVGQRMDGLAEPSERDRDVLPVDATQAFDLSAARRTGAFWIVAGATAIWSMTFTAVTFNIVPMVTSRGLAAADAGMLFFVFGITLAAAQLVGGLLADRMPLHLLLAA
ncbi:MAG: MFS transporter, partial [Phycisphaeraceae bacterium]|nr:MFS transporter [Phycisphaeraceae bacterium]